MKVCIVSMLVCLAIGAFAQDTVEPTAAPTTCLEGSSSNGVGNFSSVPCMFGRGYSCETRLEVNGVNQYIERKCKQTKACVNSQNSNANHCYSEEALNKQVRICYFCCNQSDCNDFSDIPPPAAPAPVPVPAEGSGQ